MDSSLLSGERLRFQLKQLRERLWVKPLVICLLSIAAVFAAKAADGTHLGRIVPHISADSIDSLLSIMASSMLVIATFAVASMVSAYASASNTATPRAFPLIVADDASQYALSTFIGAFIFSIVALIAVKNDYYDTAGLFTVFVLTVTAFIVVILTFVRWVDRIARLGRMAATIDKVEQATATAMRRRRDAPYMHGVPYTSAQPKGEPVFATTVGYVQHIDIAAVQSCAEAAQGRVVVAALPGTLATPDRPLAYVEIDDIDEHREKLDSIAAAFSIGNRRTFDDDPRFGLVVLAEIAGRALSPGVNDPGSAIDIINALLRLFVLWNEPRHDAIDSKPRYDRVVVPAIAIRDMFEDAFTVIARDGAGSMEVAVRLQKALRTLATCGDPSMRDAALHHRRLALTRAEQALELAEDLAAVRNAAGVPSAAD